MYVCQLQKQYFRDGGITFKEYETKMKQIEEIAENLHLKDLYKHT